MQNGLFFDTMVVAHRRYNINERRPSNPEWRPIAEEDGKESPPNVHAARR